MKSFCNFCKNFYLLILFIIKQKDCKEEIISTSFTGNNIVSTSQCRTE